MVSKAKRKTVTARSPSMEVSSDDSSSSAASTATTTSRDGRSQRTRKPRGTTTAVASSSSTSSSTSSTRGTKARGPKSTKTSSYLPQSVLLVGIFAMGWGSGVAYVGWIQDQYGYGKDVASEQRYLPWGLITSHVCHPPLTEVQSIPNEEEPHQYAPPSTVVPTLFGMNYHQARSSVVVEGGQRRPPTTTNTVDTSTAAVVSNQQQRHGISSDLYRLATTREVRLTPSETAMIQSVGADVHAAIPHLHDRAQQVSWGGPQHAVPETHWWFPTTHNRQSSSGSSSNQQSSDLSQLEGGHLLYSYLYIMKWNPHPQFPFRLCGETGCPPERAVAHSLEWREKYKPWLVPPSVLQENFNGYVYHRGFSPILVANPDDSTTVAGKHGTVFVRLNHRVQDDLAFFRGILHSADRAIADALRESDGEVGKFNVIFDCQGFSLSNAPSRHALKQGVTMLQDHYANRLGMIFLAQLPRVGEIFLKIVLGLITKEVRDKIKILPNHDKAKSLAILKMVLEEESIPDYLGGTDTYRFDLDSYYPPEVRCTEEEAREFLATMPYHAK